VFALLLLHTYIHTYIMLCALSVYAINIEYPVIGHWKLTSVQYNQMEIFFNFSFIPVYMSGTLNCMCVRRLDIYRSVVNIGNAAFSYSGLRSVVIPTSVTFIDEVIMVVQSKVCYPPNVISIMAFNIVVFVGEHLRGVPVCETFLYRATC
jgi:hypothetical protein